MRSRTLLQDYGLTVPQLAALRAIGRLQPVKGRDLAKGIHLAQPTVTGILGRLEQRGLVRCTRGAQDRRSLEIRLTDEGERVLRDAPSLLQDEFLRKLDELEPAERTQTLTVLQQVADMMDAEGIDAAPVLSSELANAMSPHIPLHLEEMEDGVSSGQSIYCSTETGARPGPLAGWLKTRRT
jgi:DNA-binding MarR family transcriptional regulator